MKTIKNKKIHTPHGTLTTPLFMPDATRGFVKLLKNQDIKKVGTKAMVVNTFHLFLHPGLKTIKKAGGIHKFMNWPHPLLSDSGGFQVFSLIYQNPKMGKIIQNGVEFKSPWDGSKHIFTPEKVIQIQFELKTDMIVCLDDCPPNNSSQEKLEEAVKNTISWAQRSKIEYEKQIKKRELKGKDKPLIFAVIQGGESIELRQKCAQALVDLDFDGYGFGAMPVNEEGKFLKHILQKTAEYIPENKLKFALGLGTPQDIKDCIAMGWDVFDCVIPTREGRHGKLFYETKTGIIKSYSIKKAKFSQKFEPIKEETKLEDLRLYTKAFLHHLFKSNSHLGQYLASLNNLEVYNNLFKRYRN